MTISIYDRLESAFGGAIINADDVSVDTSSLADITATNIQQIASELERLYTLVRSIQNSDVPSGRSLVLFSSSVDITSGNYNTYANKNSVYSANNNQVINFTLPLESDISTYPSTFEISHLGGTERFDSGSNPTNTIILDLDSSDATSLETPAGATKSTENIHRGDTVVISKESPGTNWVVRKSNLNLSSTILPNGLFKLNSTTVDLSGNDIVGLAGVTVNVGDAFTVATGGNALGASISANDVIVSRVDNPSISGGSQNNDWIVIRESSNSQLTLQEIRFLSQVLEQDTPVDTRVNDGTADTEAYVWLSPYVLDHEPSKTPSTDTNNPQSGETEEYIGGTETQNANYDFINNQNHFQSLLYIGIKTSYLNRPDVRNSDIYVQLFDIDGTTKIFEYRLSDLFVTPVGYSSADYSYFVYSHFDIGDSFTSIRYQANQTIRIIHRTQNRHFSLSDSVDVTSNVINLQENQLSETIQGKLNREHALEHEDRVRLDAIETTETSTAVPTSPSFSFKYKYGEISHLESDYQTQQNSNGILGQYDSSVSIVVRVDSNVTITHLAHDGLSDISVTEITPSIFDGEKVYTATIPGISGSIGNTIFDHPVTIVGTIANFEATGMSDTVKMGLDNIDDSFSELIHRPINNPYVLPDNLQTLSDNITISTDTVRRWEKVFPYYLNNDLTREVALLWDFNWYGRSATEVNEFDDIEGVEALGYSNDDFKYYADEHDSANTRFPGRNSYIVDSEIRFRNETGVDPAPIDDTFRKVLFFDFSEQVRLGEDQRSNVLKLGLPTEEPFIEYTEHSGLVMRVSTQDAPSTTRNRNVPVTVENSQWTINDGINSDPTSRVILPDDIVSGQSVTVHLSLRVTEGLPDPTSFIPGAGTYTATENLDLTITNIDNNQTFANHTFSYTGLTHESVTVSISYEHAHQNDGQTRRVILVDPTLPLESGHVTYSLGASFDAVETFRPGTGYTDLNINVGSQTRQIHTPNRVGMIFQKWREDDTDSDPTIGVKLIVDGSLFGSSDNDYLINTHRRASQFRFDDITIGGFEVGTSKVQMYKYNPSRIPTADDLTRYYAQIDNWLGSFINNSSDETRIRINNIEILDNDIPTDEQHSVSERYLRNHLSLDNESATGDWRALSPQPIESGLTRRFALFFDENKITTTGNIFNDVTGLNIGGYENKTRFYTSTTQSLNNDLPGVTSYEANGTVSVSNTTGDSPIPNTENFVLGFDYSILNNALEKTLLRFGGAIEPLLSTDNQGKLLLHVGAQNGTRRSRNYDIPLSIEDSHWNSTTDDGGQNARTEVPLPFSSSHPTIKVRCHLDINGVDSGNAVHTFTFDQDIRQNDKNFGTITFDFGSGNTLVTTANYTFSSRKLSITASNSLTDATKVYNFEASITTFEAWNIPDTANHPNQAYHKQILNIGNTGLRQRNRVLMMMTPYRFGDSDSDPEMAIRIIVNNSRSGTGYNDYKIRTYRPRSDFDFNNITIGYSDPVNAPTFAIGRVQHYNYDINRQPSSEDMLVLYSGIDRFLDAFTNQDNSSTRLLLDSDLIFDEDKGVITIAANGNKYKLTVSDTGTLGTTLIT